MINKNDFHVTLRHAIWAICLCAAFIFAMSRIFPPPHPVNAPVAVITPSPIEHEISALEKSDQTISSTLKGVVSVLQRPGATVVSKVTGFTPSQSAQILAATKPHTAQTVTVKVIAPTPAPEASDELSRKIFDAAYAADTKAITQTKTNVQIGYQETPVSRFGSAFLAGGGGTGLSYTAVRKGYYEIDLAAVLNSANHAVPAICPGYQIPHTSLSGNICASYNHGFRISFGAIEKF